MLTDENRSLLHYIVADVYNSVAVKEAKLQYLCSQCPVLINLKDDEGMTPLHYALTVENFSIELVKTLCDADRTVVRERCSPSDLSEPHSGQLPLHLFTLLNCSSQTSEISVTGDCFRLLLNRYPAAAGIKDNHLNSPYDIATSRNLSTYFIRLLVRADPSINPEQRRNLNFESRRELMFLAFRAMSSNVEPTIWTKLSLKSDLIQCVISYL
jgi:ankyrin repeat protein